MKSKTNLNSCCHRMMCVLATAAAVGLVTAHSQAFAQDTKQAFVDAKSAGVDFTLQGEYIGWVLTGSQDFRPIGLQVIGPYLEDYTTIAFARAAEGVCSGFTPPSPVG